MSSVVHHPLSITGQNDTLARNVITLDWTDGLSSFKKRFFQSMKQNSDVHNSISLKIMMEKKRSMEITMEKTNVIFFHRKLCFISSRENFSIFSMIYSHHQIARREKKLQHEKYPKRNTSVFCNLSFLPKCLMNNIHGGKWEKKLCLHTKLKCWNAAQHVCLRFPFSCFFSVSILHLFPFFVSCSPHSVCEYNEFVALELI